MFTRPFVSQTECFDWFLERELGTPEGVPNL